MLIVGTWVALLLYIISWVSVQYTSPLANSTGTRFHAWSEVTGMRLAWFIHTVTLLGLLWTKSVWPITFVSDILSAAAWGSMVGIQAFPSRLPSLFNTSIVRLFVIFLLGLSLFVSHKQLVVQEIVSTQTWIYQLLLGSHIILLLASYVMLGVACLSSIIFLYQEHHLKTKLVTSMMVSFPALGTLERLSWQGTLWGFLGLSIGLMLGLLIKNTDQSFLANLRFASSICAWIVFALLILLKQLQLLRTYRIAFLPIIGFIFVLMSLIVELLRYKLPE